MSSSRHRVHFAGATPGRHSGGRGRAWVGTGAGTCGTAGMLLGPLPEAAASPGVALPWTLPHPPSALASAVFSPAASRSRAEPPETALPADNTALDWGGDKAADPAASPLPPPAQAPAAASASAAAVHVGCVHVPMRGPLRGPPLPPRLPRDALAAAAFAPHRRVRCSSIDSWSDRSVASRCATPLLLPRGSPISVDVSASAG